jgi:AcrR family transcriptional regulator
VFGQAGYDAATTNAIAARAGVSPGTLYQFFANKAAIAEALAIRYADQLEQVARPADGPVEDLLAGSIDAMVAVNLAQPGVGALLAAEDVTVSPAHRLHAIVADRLDELLAARAPRLSAAERARFAQVVTQIYKAMLPIIAAANQEDQALLTAELRHAIIRYLAPYLSAGQRDRKGPDEYDRDIGGSRTP